MPTVQLEMPQFSGPLDLLLSLLEEKKLAISEVALSHVTERFLAYLDTLESHRAEELADFLLIGSKLLLLKSKALLPQFAPEEDEGPSLEEQLRLYKKFIEASRGIHRLWLGQKTTYFRREPVRMPTQFVSPANVSRDSLAQAMVQLVSRLKPPKPLPETQIDKTVSLKEKIDRIRAFIDRNQAVSFHDVLDSARNRTDIIVSFLAILELVKQKTVALRQDDTFGDIMIHRAA